MRSLLIQGGWDYIFENNNLETDGDKSHVGKWENASIKFLRVINAEEAAVKKLVTQSNILRFLYLSTSREHILF